MSAPQEAPESLGIEAQDLEHLARAALHLCGLGAHEALLVTGLRGPGPLLLPDALDLGAIWQPLIGAAQAPPEQAARVLLLLQVYLGRNAQGLLERRPPRLPEEAAAAIEGIGAQLQDPNELNGQLQRMAQLAGEFSAAGYTPPPGPGAGQAPRPSSPRLPLLVGPLDPPMPAPTAPPAARGPAPQKKPPAQPAAGGGRRLSFVGVVAATLLVLLAGYWGIYGYYRLYLADSHTRVDVNALQVVMPVREARVNRDTLIVITPDDAYTKRPPEEQARLGRQLLAVLAQQAVDKVTILSGDKQYRITSGKRGSRMVVTPPPNRPGEQLGRQPGQPGRGRGPGGQRGAPPAKVPAAPEPPPQGADPTTET
jgi:hypothetical protein